MYQRYMICNKKCMMLRKNIYPCIFPIPQHVKQKGKCWCSLKKKKLLNSNTCNGNLHKNSSFTLLLPLPEETLFRPDTKKPRISTSQYYITLHSLLHRVFFLFYKQRRYRILLKVSIWGEAGVVKTVASQIHFLWFLHNA